MHVVGYPLIHRDLVGAARLTMVAESAADYLAAFPGACEALLTPLVPFEPSLAKDTKETHKKLTLAGMLHVAINFGHRREDRQTALDSCDNARC